MTLIGLEENLNKCLEAIKTYVGERILTVDCEVFPLNTWNQETIDSFYKYCFERQVLPEVTLPGDKLKLSGPKDATTGAQIEFYRLKGAKADEARIISYSRLAVWLYEIENEVFEKYSLQVNASIETAYSHENESVRIK